jgi:hypothetical protein
MEMMEQKRYEDLETRIKESQNLKKLKEQYGLDDDDDGGGGKRRR